MNDWKNVRLGDVATIERTSIQPDEIQDDTPYLGLEHIESGGDIHGAQIVKRGELASSKFQFTERHLLYGKLRPYLSKIACPDFNGICSTDILPVLPGSKLNRKYLCYYLRQPSKVALANSQATGANLPRLSPSVLAEIEIPLPPLSEQKRIAEILDRAESLRRQRRAALALLDELTQSIFLDMFGDPANPTGWPSRPLGEILDEQRPISYGILKPGDYHEDGVAMLRIQDIRGGNVSRDGLHRVSHSLSNQYKRTLLSGGEVVISLVGTIGLCALVPLDFAGANVHRNLAVVVPAEGMEPRFVFRCMASAQFQRCVKETTKGGNQGLLNLGDLKRLPIPVPPLALQRKFVAIDESLETEKTLVRRHLGELNRLFASLQHRAFRGEL